jgi:hypothetical protein
LNALELNQLGSSSFHKTISYFSSHLFSWIRQGIDNWSFDVFGLGVASNGQVLKYLGYDLLNRYGFIHKFKVSLLFSLE